MFRNILAHLLIITSLAANFSQVFVYAGFEMNENYIVSKLCINRDKPEMHCNGKCYLMRKLKQAEQKEKSRERESQRTLLQPGLVAEKIAVVHYTICILREYQPELPFRLPQYTADIFQPPRLNS